MKILRMMILRRPTNQFNMQINTFDMIGCLLSITSNKSDWFRFMSR